MINRKVTQNAAPDVMTTEEAAVFLAVRVSWLERSRRKENAEGAPPFFHVGKHVRYRRADLEKWIAARVVLPETKTI